MEYPENTIPYESSFSADSNREPTLIGAFRKYIFRLEALPWIGVLFALVAVFALQISTLISLGLSRLGSQHRYYDGYSLTDPIEDFVSTFVILPVWILGPVLFSIGSAGLIIRSILTRPKENPEASNSLRIAGSVAVGLLFVVLAFLLLLVIGAILLGIGFGYETWKDTLPFPEVLRHK